MSSFSDRLLTPQKQDQQQDFAGRLFNNKEAFRDRVEAFEARSEVTPSMSDIVSEAVTGEERQTQATETLPSLMEVGIRNFLGDNAGTLAELGVTAGLLLTADQERQINILSQIPDVGFQQDEKGNIIVTNQATQGKALLNPPGLDRTDVLGAGAKTAAFLPSGRIASIGGQTVGGAIGRTVGTAAAETATEAGLDVATQALGGTEEVSLENIDTGNLIATALTAGATQGVAEGARGISGADIRPQVREGVRGARENKIPLFKDDVFPPSTFVGKQVQRAGERIPVIGAGRRRARQQSAIENASEELFARFGIEESTDFADDILLGVERSVTNKIERASQLRKAATTTLDAAGPMNTPKSVARVDDLIGEQIGPGAATADRALISKLEAYQTDLADANSFSDVVAIRTRVIRDIQKRSRGDIIFGDPNAGELKRLKTAIDADLNDFATVNPEAGRQWRASNRLFNQGYTEGKNQALKRILRDAEDAPRAIRSIIEGKNVTQMRQLYRNLDEPGREAARRQVLQTAYEKAANADGTINPNVLATNLNKLDDQINIFFQGQDKAAVKGLRRALDFTRRAQDASVLTPTGQENWLLALLGGTGAGVALAPFETVVALGVAGSAALVNRAIQSRPIRNLLIRINSGASRGADVSNLVRELNAALQPLAVATMTEVYEASSQEDDTAAPEETPQQ